MTTTAPPGTLTVTVTYLELAEPPAGPPLQPPRAKLSLVAAERPTLSFYRFLYRSVGEPWLWADRLRMGDDALTARIQSPRTSLYVLYEAGVPAGYVELYVLDDETTEIAYFGLMPEFTGLGLGPYLLDQAIRCAWAAPTRRLQVETCTLDHPKALPTYQRAGFTPYRRETVFRRDPRLLGLVPTHAAPSIPLAADRLALASR